MYSSRAMLGWFVKVLMILIRINGLWDEFPGPITLTGNSCRNSDVMHGASVLTEAFGYRAYTCTCTLHEKNKES